MCSAYVTYAVSVSRDDGRCRSIGVASPIVMRRVLSADLGDVRMSNIDRGVHLLYRAG
jgi:hypothetical protein